MGMANLTKKPQVHVPEIASTDAVYRSVIYRMMQLPMMSNGFRRQFQAVAKMDDRLAVCVMPSPTLAPSVVVNAQRTCSIAIPQLDAMILCSKPMNIDCCRR